MVRFLPLRRGRRARLPENLLPGIGPLHGNTAGVFHVLRRVRGPSVRSGNLRPLRRSDRPKGRAHRHAGPDGRRYHGDRFGARLRPHWDLGRRAARGGAHHAGRRRGGRVGRLGAARRRVDESEAARLHDELGAVWSAGRPDARQRRGVNRDLLDVGRTISFVGLAGSVPDQFCARLHRLVHPDRHSRDAGVRPLEGPGQG